jgi:CubicO group peptidase (beta-lactamase class C family)
LSERGRIELDAPVSRYIEGFGQRGVLDRFGETVPLNREPTILDLLTHTSGLTYGNFGNEHIHRLYQAAGVIDYSLDNAEIARRLADLPLLHQPGTVFEYGMSTDLLGRIVELATGETLATAFETMIFQPLGDELCTSFHIQDRAMSPCCPRQTFNVPWRRH